MEAFIAIAIGKGELLAGGLCLQGAFPWLWEHAFAVWGISGDLNIFKIDNNNVFYQ